MLFKVIHINQVGQRRRAWVTASCAGGALEQMEARFGVALGGGCLRSGPVPGLALVPVLGVVGSLPKEHVCVA